jgi:maleate isomerase
MTARIGLIIPSSNRMVEQEMVRHTPPGVTAHVARLRMTGAHNVPLDCLTPRVEETAATLIDARCDVVAFHCTANSMSEGLGGEAKLLGALRQAGAALATTTATAIRRAFDALGARRIVLLTPYSARTTEEEAEFLHAAGYDVIFARGFALKGSDEYCSTPPQFWRDRALEAARPDADAYLLSCANISVFPIIDEIEQKLDRPVVTSNQVVIWDALSLTGIGDRRNCPGRLFDSLGQDQTARRARA